MNNPYEILGISPSSNEDEIKNAYRDKARIINQDNYASGQLSDSAAQKMKELDEAYDMIMSQKRTGGYSPNYNYSTGYSGSSESSASYGKIRDAIRFGDINSAQAMLDSIPQMSRVAEWYYLQGMIQQQKGWSNAAFDNYRQANQMDPSNPEYARAYESMNNHRSGGYRTEQRGSSSNCNFCDICQGLICADCCCECMGGDLISCC